MLGLYLEYLKAKGDKARTIEWHAQKLEIFKQWLLTTGVRNRPVREDIIYDYMDYRRQQGKSSNTIEGDVRCLASMFSWAYAQGYISANPCANIKKPKATPCEEDPFTPSEVAKMLCYLEPNQDELSIRNTAIVLFLYDTGIRTTAMCNIKAGDMDFENRQVMVTEKYGKRKRLSWGDRTHDALKRYEKARSDNEYFFVSRRGCKLTRSGIYSMVQKLCVASGVRRRKVHLFRSAYSCEFLTVGGPERGWQLQFILGHADMSQIKNVYGRKVMNQLTNKTMQELSPADRLDLLGANR